MSGSRLTILDESPSPAEWRIGYVDAKPAVGDHAGRWYIVPQDAVVPQPSRRLVWLADQGEWSCISSRHWDPEQVPPTDPARWLAAGPAYVEPAPGASV